MSPIKRMFISYSRADKIWTYDFAKLLREELDLDAFVDYRNIHIGTDWWRVICENIEGCDCGIFVMSPTSIESLYCEAEIEYLVALNKPILPIMLKKCNPPEILNRRRIQYLLVNNQNKVDLKILLEIQKGLTSVLDLKHKGEYTIPHPLPSRPSEPKPKHIKNVEEIFELAAEAANEGQLKQAEEMFEQASKADEGRIGFRAKQRLEEIRSYIQVERYTKKLATIRDARILWKNHCEIYGNEFDPWSLANKLEFIQDAESDQIADTQPITSLNNLSNPVKRDNDVQGSVKNPAQQALIRAKEFKNLSTNSTSSWLRFTGQSKNTKLFNNAWKPFFISLSKLKIPDIRFCLVPTGEFKMGSDDGHWQDEQPVNNQTIDKPYLISKYPVTNSDWAIAVKEGVVSEPEGDKALRWYKDSSMVKAPVVGITWFDAQKFSDWIGCRLPSEKEWEYAVRGVESLRYPWGNNWNPDMPVWYKNSDSKPWNVSTNNENQSWVGAVHMIGNIWEWTSSIYKNYPYSDDHKKTTDKDIRMVLRGGSWWDDNSNYLRAACRNSALPSYRNAYWGFRLAKSI